MQALWHAVRWVGGKLLFLATMVCVSLLMLLLPSLRGMRGFFVGNRQPIYTFSSGDWWRRVVFHLDHLFHGHLLPANLTISQGNAWRGLQSEIWSSLAISLKLMSVSLVAGLVAGIALGWLISRLAPGWVRRPAFGMAGLLACLPDILVATFLDLALIIFGQQRSGLALWNHFLAPTLALTILLVPYVARVTAAAIDEVSGQVYIRTAVAKGVAPRGVVLRHMGKNVLIQIWTALPVVVGILVSSLALIEFLMEIRGIGRALVLAAGPRAEQLYGDRYAAVLLLFPLLLLFALVSALTDAGLKLLDPRIREYRARQSAGGPFGAGNRRPAAKPDRRLGSPTAQAQAARPIGERLRQTITEAAQSAAQWCRAFPERLRLALKALRDPVLLAGVIMVAALVLIALLAHKIAPYDPERHFTAFQDASGKVWGPPYKPSPVHWLGTDTLGRDMWSRVVVGTRYALLFAGLATPARFAVAVFLGMLAAWRGGLWQRVIDWLGIFFTAVPAVILPLALINLFNDVYANRLNVALAWGVALVALPGIPRLAAAGRQMTATVLARPFIEGAVAVGVRPGRLLWRHILPQMAPQLATMFTLEVPAVMVLAATLAFFKVSPGGWIIDTETHEIIAPRLPEWGSMMDSPLLMVLSGRWWFWVPFIALFVAVLAFTLLGEGMRRHWGKGAEWQWRA